MMPITRATSIPSRRVTISASSMDLPPLPPPAVLPRLAAAPLRRPRGLRAALAQAVDLQAVGGRQEAVGAADLGLQRGDPRAHELHHPAACGAYQMIVPLTAVNVLVEEAAAAETL